MKKTLTKAEEQVMMVLWKIKAGFLKEILDEMPDPKPHSNTLATILKILVEKDFVGIRTYGRLNQYYPLLQKDAYSNDSIKSLVNGYFEGSFSNVVSFMVHKKELSVNDLELLLEGLKKTKQ